MRRQERHIKNKPMKIPGKVVKSRFESDMSVEQEDQSLFDTIGKSMRGMADIEDVKNDPDLSATRDAVREMMSDYYRNLSVNRNNEKFIKDNVEEENPVYKLSDDLKFIRQEIDEKNLDLVTSEWVREWHEKKQKIGSHDPKSEEISKFITETINSPLEEPTVSENEEHIKGFNRKLFVRYISLSAAAVVGLFLLIKVLLPSSNQENLFKTYYKPFEAISPVTRSINNTEPDLYSSAIKFYKAGEYQSAIAGFNALLLKDPSSEKASFFLGLSYLGMGNYDSAIAPLSRMADIGGEYSKEAKWYLGLSYLETGELQKAEECFKFLAKAEGYYQDRSEKILRRLK